MPGLALLLARFSLRRRRRRPPLLQRRPVLQAGLLHAGRDGLLLHARGRRRWLRRSGRIRLLRQARRLRRLWLLARPLRQSRLRRTRPRRQGILFLLRQAVLLLARLTRRVGGGIIPGRIGSGRILLALNAPLGDDLAAEVLRGVNLTH